MSSIRVPRLVLGILVAMALPLGGCSNWYYDLLGKFGIEKRDLLVKRVKAARDSEDAAKEQFTTALDRFRAVVPVEGGKLEDEYDALKSQLDDCESRAKEVHDHVAKVDDVANALFADWKKELGQYKSAKLRRASERKLVETERRYGHLIQLMRRAEKRLDPALVPLRDYVLYLGHNMNARALAAVSGEVESVQDDVAALVTDMDHAVREADAFVAELDRNGDNDRDNLEPPAKPSTPDDPRAAR